MATTKEEFDLAIQHFATLRGGDIAAYQGVYSSTGEYYPGDIVNDAGTLYVSLTGDCSGPNPLPVSDPNGWLSGGGGDGICGLPPLPPDSTGTVMFPVCADPEGPSSMTLEQLSERLGISDLVRYVVLSDTEATGNATSTIDQTGLPANEYLFTVPDDVNILNIDMIAGGGGGGSNSGGGGGSGALLNNLYNVTPGQVLFFEVGLGGNGGAASNPGTTGGNSRMRQTNSSGIVLLTTQGGQGGDGGDGGVSDGGNGGAGYFGGGGGITGIGGGGFGVINNGSNGLETVPSGTGQGGGDGGIVTPGTGTPGGGGGGPGGGNAHPTGAGDDGSLPGAGGGGGSDTQNGGNGASGQIIISF